MMRKVLMFVFAMCLALFAVSAMAQSETTGSIAGTVTDPQGRPVANATVTATGPTSIRPQSAQTDDQGRYQILGLPPGTYTVTVSATAGFAETKKDNIAVNLSKTSTADVEVKIAGASAEVTITDTSGAAVDVNSNTTGTNVSSEQFSNFPTQRTVQSLYTISPTVARSGLRDTSGRDRDPSVGGSSGPENNYILDGVQTTDPAFGGSGANLPFEFVQEVEIKTGAFGAEYGKSTGGIFNVITKSGGNEFHGDIFAYGTPTKSFVRKTTSFPATGSAPNGFSEIDAGGDVGGPIKKDRLWFFGAFNPQQRKNYFLTQFFRQNVSNKVTTPFYAGKLTWAVNNRNTLTLSTFGDFTKQEGFLFGGSGFGNPDSFIGRTETGGSNYTARLNSTIRPTWIGEFAFGLHFQRANTIPSASTAGVALVTENFAVISSGGTFITPTAFNTQTTPTGGIHPAFVNGTGGVLQRGYALQGWGLQSHQNRDREEFSARFQNIYGRHTFKYGFEWLENKYKILTNSTGPLTPFVGSSHAYNGLRITNNFGVCQGVGTNIVCPSSTFTGRAAQGIALGAFPGYLTASTGSVALGTITNPILVLSTVSVRDFQLNTGGQFTNSRTESAYIQDDFKITPNVTFNFGLREDWQQSYSTHGTSYLKLNNFKDNLQPRVGLIWDFTGKGKGKLFVNYARYLETPLPLDINVRAGGNDVQTDFNARVNTLNAPAGSTITTDFGCLGCDPTPPDPDLKPQTVNEATAGFEYEIARDFALGARGVYRAQGSVIEDGSFDDGTTYFLFNPGESLTDRLAEQVIGQRFGRARRYYRAMEFTATKRFSNNWQFIGSYVYSSLIGNYEGLFRNDNGQSDPNITSLFDLVSLLANAYGRLPNDRPHQLKMDGTYRTPWKLQLSGSFRWQSGIPFDQLIPHPVYGNNEGFAVPRGTAINPLTGSNRTPTTFNLDLGVYYPIALGEKRQLRLQLDWFNVTNEQRAIRQDTTFQINSGVSGIAPVGNPFFGTGTIFQFPSSIRLGAKFQF